MKINKMEKEAIFLAGGGGKEDSATLDSILVDTLSARKINRIVYIPIAITSRPYEQCLEWFKSIFGGKIPEIEMWTDLKDRKLSAFEDRTAIYLGGGDTLRLFKIFQDTGFDKELKEFVLAGGVLYGGSAGAVILGKDIRTAPEARNSSPSKGLNLLGGFSVFCHYTDEKRDEVLGLAKKFGINIYALTEQAGVVVSKNEVRIVNPVLTFTVDDKSGDIQVKYLS